MNRSILGTDDLPAHTSGAVKQAIAYLHQNYTRPISRWEIAEAVGVSEDYLSRVFNRELNISPWDYLNRYRVLQSKHLLLHTTRYDWRHCSSGGLQRPSIFQPRVS
jgi:transcriptional regulator GlxA family with amidase domain